MSIYENIVSGMYNKHTVPVAPGLSEGHINLIQGVLNHV